MYWTSPKKNTHLYAGSPDNVIKVITAWRPHIYNRKPVLQTYRNKCCQVAL